MFRNTKSKSIYDGIEFDQEPYDKSSHFAVHVPKHPFTGQIDY